MPIEMTVFPIHAASTGAAGFFQPLLENPLFVILILLIGVAIGSIWALFYSRLKAKYFSSEADQKIKSIVADFKKEKDTSETILRELQVGVLAYGADGRLITGNPSANALLGISDIPQTIQSFLNQYGKDNGISLALMLQTTNVTGNVNVQDRIVRLRLTRAQLSMFRNPSWIIIIQDITEQEREEKQRKEFVANVSHELKTPLTTISAYSETLLDWGLEGKPLQEIRGDVARIHDDCERMDNLVQNLLLLSSIDSRGIRPKMIQYDVVSIMKQVVYRMQVQAVDKEIDLQTSVLSIIPPVYGDANAIDRIITNLVSNAVKYTDRRGHVNVSVQLTNNYISLKIVDDGMGVSKENLPRLFDRFYRVDSTGSRKYGGTGLGLSIAKELTELQGGTISVSSTLGKGTEFVVTIPKAESTYRETIAAILSDSPRTEILFENARQFLQNAAEEIDIPVYSLEKITEAQIEELLSYLLMVPEDDVKIQSIPSRPAYNRPEVKEQSARAPIPALAERSPERLFERGNEKLPEPSPEKPLERPPEKPTERPTEKPPEKLTERPPIIPRPLEKPVEPVVPRVVEVARSDRLTPPQMTSPLRQTAPRPLQSKPIQPEQGYPGVPIKRNADVVSQSSSQLKNIMNPKEPSDRLTKSKIHPDNRQRTDFSDKSTAEPSKERTIVTIDELQQETIRGKRHVQLPD